MQCGWTWATYEIFLRIRMINQITRELILTYFHLGLSYDEILCFLALKHRTVISKRTLHRTLRRLSLGTRKTDDLLEVAKFINEQLQGSGRLNGYRWMHLRCIQHGLRVSRDRVYYLLQILDPEGIQMRKRCRLARRQYISKGPNYVWHLDSYDKLKPYGICINGCIDGYSRYVLWLEASTTNSDPKVIAGFFTTCIRGQKGCPQRLRADMGTENCYVEQMQIFLRREHADAMSGDKSFISGKSTHNQRIEWFWGIVRKQVAQFWMNLLHSLQQEEDCMFCGDFLDKGIVQFCFMKLIQNDLDTLRDTWNSHTISSANHRRQANRPLMMYTLPELYDKEECLCPVDMDELSLCEEETLPKPLYDETVSELCMILMEERSLLSPSSGDEAKRLYSTLRQAIRSYL